MKILFSILIISLFATGRGEFNYLPTSTTNQVVKHTYYTLSYSEKYEQAEWVAYELTDEMVKGQTERTDNFREDPLVLTGSATLEDYKGSGYDRGHLCPAGDMKINQTAMSESFYLSNMSPQKPDFNRGIWEKLESQVRKWAIENKHLYIITGGVLKGDLPTIGVNKVGVPKYYYKVVLDYTEPEIKEIGFILPNEKSIKQLYEYVISVDSIENLTGIDFFPALPDDIEEELESAVDANKWFK